LVFAYRLASQLGVANVEEEGGLLDQISYRQLERWNEFYNFDPWGPMRTDIMLAQLCALLVNVHRGKGQRAARPKDFLPDFGKAPGRKQSMGEMKAILRQHAAVHNKVAARNG